MSADGSAHVRCPDCSAKYRWRKELAGRKARCTRCGGIVLMPMQQPGDGPEFQQVAGGFAIKLPGDDAADDRGPIVPATPERLDLPERPLSQDFEQVADEPPDQPTPVAANAGAEAADQPADDSDDGGEYELSMPEEIVAASRTPSDEAAKREEASDAGSGGYELEVAGVKKVEAHCPSCGRTVKPGSVLCVNCGLNLTEGRKLQTSVVADGQAVADGTAPPELSDPNEYQSEAELEAERRGRWEDLHLPLILVGVGSFIAVINYLFLVDPTGFTDRLPPNLQSFGPVVVRLIMLIAFAVRAVISVPFLLLGIVVVAKLFGTSFGGLFTALLKLLALAVMLGAIDETVTSILNIITDGEAWMGFMMTWAISYGVFLALAAKLLETDMIESFVLYLIVKLLPFFAMMLCLGMLYSLIT